MSLTFRPFKHFADFGVGRLLGGVLKRQRPRARLVSLSPNQLAASAYEGMVANPAYSNVIEDLLAYTGFSEEELKPYLLRAPEKHFESEFDWVRPRDRKSLTWFYRTSSAYLFANACHPYSSALDVLTEGPVLDYGAGVGCHSIPLAKRGLEVDFVEISRMQADFLRFRAMRHGLTRLHELLPFFQGRFDPVRCITRTYRAIVAMDVLEHIPDYHLLVRHFIEHLEPGGLIIENSPFDPDAREIAIHVAPSMPLERAMEGMQKVTAGVWRKER
jgi:2-polyprenyl-3-methyl-5-hydroxy-6-metoxy-1,4-benzoquinol methylase